MLANRLTDSDIDFWTIVDDKGEVLARGLGPMEKGERVVGDPVVSEGCPERVLPRLRSCLSSVLHGRTPLLSGG